MIPFVGVAIILGVTALAPDDGQLLDALAAEFRQNVLALDECDIQFELNTGSASTLDAAKKGDYTPTRQATARWSRGSGRQRWDVVYPYDMAEKNIQKTEGGFTVAFESLRAVYDGKAFMHHRPRLSSVVIGYHTAENNHPGMSPIGFGVAGARDERLLDKAIKSARDGQRGITVRVGPTETVDGAATQRIDFTHGSTGSVESWWADTERGCLPVQMTQVDGKGSEIVTLRTLSFIKLPGGRWLPERTVVVKPAGDVFSVREVKVTSAEIHAKTPDSVFRFEVAPKTSVSDQIAEKRDVTGEREKRVIDISKYRNVKGGPPVAPAPELAAAMVGGRPWWLWPLVGLAVAAVVIIIGWWRRRGTS